MRRLVTINEVCSKLSVSKSTVRNWIRGLYRTSRGVSFIDVGFPKPIRIGRCIRFYEDEIDAFVEARANA